jgi:hypothetical protein
MINTRDQVAEAFDTSWTNASDFASEAMIQKFHPSPSLIKSDIVFFNEQKGTPRYKPFVKHENHSAKV